MDESDPSYFQLIKSLFAKKEEPEFDYIAQIILATSEFNEWAIYMQDCHGIPPSKYKELLAKRFKVNPEDIGKDIQNVKTM